MNLNVTLLGWFTNVLTGEKTKHELYTRMGVNPLTSPKLRWYCTIGVGSGTS